MENTKAKKIIITTIILLLIICMIVVIFKVVDIYKANNNAENNETQNNGNSNANMENVVLTKEQEDFINDFTEFLSNIVIEGAKNSAILKSTSGDVAADKLTEQEAIQNQNNYITLFKNNINNREICSNIFIINNQFSITYNIEEVLALLGCGTHMGAGMGASDYNGLQLYTQGDTPTIDTNNTVFEEFNYSLDVFVGNILNKIRSYANDGLLIKGTGEKATKDKVTTQNIDNNEQQILSIIKDEILSKSTKKVWTGNTLQVTYCMETILENLGWSLVTFNGLGINEYGLITENAVSTIE